MDSQEMQRSRSTQPSAANQTLPFPQQQLDRLVAALASDQLQSVASSYQSNDRVLLPVIGGLADPKGLPLPGYSTVKDRVQPPISEEASLEPSQATGSGHAEAAKALRKSVEGGVKAVKEQDGQIMIQIDDVAADAIQRMTTTNKKAAGQALGAIGEEQAGTPYTAERRGTWSTQKRQSVDFTSEARVDKSASNADETVIGDVLAGRLTSDEFAVLPQQPGSRMLRNESSVQQMSDGSLHLDDQLPPAKHGHQRRRSRRRGKGSRGQLAKSLVETHESAASLSSQTPMQGVVVTRKLAVQEAAKREQQGAKSIQRTR